MAATARTEKLQVWIQWLQGGSKEQKHQAAMALRTLASEVSNKNAIREAGGIEALLQLLDSENPTSPLTVAAAETLSCLAADDPENREAIRKGDGIQKLVNLLAAGPEEDCTHRALLALRILTDRESDRNCILKAGGIPLLVKLLDVGPDNEITEYAAAALGNLAAGGHALKDGIRAAGGVEPLVQLLRENPDEISAELAAVALRNMALQNNLNRQAIIKAGGLQPLLHLLSSGQEKLVIPLACEIVYNDVREDGTASRKFMAGLCCFDPRRAELCIAVRSEPGAIGCFTKAAKQGSPRDRSAERYSLLRKLTLTEPDARTLELVFTVADKLGAPRLTEAGVRAPSRRLDRILISPCAATEIKGAIMRMLTRTHLEREFKIGKQSGRISSLASLSTIGLARTPSMARQLRAANAVAV